MLAFRAHFHIHTSQSCLIGGMGPVPVGHDDSLKAPLFFQDIVQKITVFRAIITAKLVVSGHYGQSAAILNGRFKSGQIDLAQGAFIHFHINPVTFIFLVIQGKMLQAGGYIVFLHPADIGNNHLTDQVGVFTHVFEISAA